MFLLFKVFVNKQLLSTPSPLDLYGRLFKVLATYRPVVQNDQFKKTVFFHRKDDALDNFFSKESEKLNKADLQKLFGKVDRELRDMVAPFQKGESVELCFPLSLIDELNVDAYIPPNIEIMLRLHKASPEIMFQTHMQNPNLTVQFNNLYALVKRTELQRPFESGIAHKLSHERKLPVKIWQTRVLTFPSKNNFQSWEGEIWNGKIPARLFLIQASLFIIALNISYNHSCL